MKTHGNSPTVPDLWGRDRQNDAYQALDRLLGSQTDHRWPTSLQFQLDVVVLEALSKGKVAQGDLLSVLKEMKTQGKNAPEDFSSVFYEFAKTKKSSSKTAPRSKSRFFFPFNISFESGLRSSRCVEVLGKTFRFRRWHDIARELGQDTFRCVLLRVTGMANPQLTETCVEAEGEGQNQVEQWNDIEPSFDAFRGLLEITLGLGSMHRSTPQRPRRAIPCPLWALSVTHGGQPEWFRFHVHEEDKKERIFQIKKGDFQVFKKNAAMFRRSPEAGSLDELFVDCLRLYSQAMDARLNHECFVGLWQLAEAVTQVNRYQGDKKRLCSRLSWFGRLWKDTDTKCLKDALEFLYEKRNVVVHRGLHKHIDDDDVNLLKLCCDAALGWVSGQRKRLPTVNALDQFFNLLGQSDSSLSMMGRVVRQIKSQRSREQKSARAKDKPLSAKDGNGDA